MQEYETTAGARTLSGQWLESKVRIVAASPDEAWQKLVKCNPRMLVAYPAVPVQDSTPKGCRH